MNGESYKFETFKSVFDESEAKSFFIAYHKGSAIDVHYDPQNPQRSYVIELDSGIRY